MRYAVSVFYNHSRAGGVVGIPAVWRVRCRQLAGAPGQQGTSADVRPQAISCTVKYCFCHTPLSLIVGLQSHRPNALREFFLCVACTSVSCWLWERALPVPLSRSDPVRAGCLPSQPMSIVVPFLNRSFFRCPSCTRLLRQAHRRRIRCSCVSGTYRAGSIA